jgi:AcrR family transcriptional regulator/DNA-binding MarR family transcriptional regulator
MRRPSPSSAELQRSRLLDAAFAVVAEQGYRRMTVRRVCDRAGVSNKTFYELFSDREDCFFAAFDYAVGRFAAVVVPAWESETDWAKRIRAGLGALLACLDEEPELCRLVFVEALGAGPRVLRRRAHVLKDLGRVVDEGRAGVGACGELPPLTAEGIVGATFGVIYGRLLEQQHAPLSGLLNALIATIVLPYRGHRDAARELARREPVLAPGVDVKGGRSLARGERSTPVDFRLTVRTYKVLVAISELSTQEASPSNREISDAAGVRDQGQISKLLRRLEKHGLLQNAGGATTGVPNAWRLTPSGEAILSTSANPTCVALSAPTSSKER